MNTTTIFIILAILIGAGLGNITKIYTKSDIEKIQVVFEQAELVCGTGGVDHIKYSYILVNSVHCKNNTTIKLSGE